MNKLQEFLFGFLRAIGQLCLVLILFVVVIRVFMWGAELSKKESVGVDVPAMFPVFVIAGDSGGVPGSSQTVYFKDLPKFKLAHPDYSFLVPEGERDVLRSQVVKDNFTKDVWFSDFKVKDLSDGRQAFEVDRSWDDDRVNRGWYQATDKEIFPQQYLYYFGPRVSLVVFPLAVIGTILLWNLPRLWRWFSRKGDQK